MNFWSFVSRRARAERLAARLREVRFVHLKIGGEWVEVWRAPARLMVAGDIGLSPPLALAPPRPLSRGFIFRPGQTPEPL
jgi:hypothetical protein